MTMNHTTSTLRRRLLQGSEKAHGLGAASRRPPFGAIDVAINSVEQNSVKPNSPAAFHRARAETLHQRGNLDAALDAARLAVKHDQNCAVTWDTLGLILAERDELAESCECYIKAVLLDPNYTKAIHNFAVVLQKLGKLDKAEIQYRAAIFTAPDNLDIKLNFATLLATLGRYHEALEIAEAVLKHNPKIVKAHIIASAIECSIGKHDAALTRVERALALAPDQIQLLTRRADLLCALGRSDAALADCNQVLSMIPHHPDALHVKAQILLALNQPQLALDAFRSAEMVSPTPAKVIADRAWLLAEIGRKDEALAALSHALKIQPDLGAAWCSRAFLKRYTSGDPDIEIMEKIADNANTPFRERMHLSFALGRAYLDMREGEKAFARLDFGNRLKRATLNYDVRADAQKFAKIAANYSGENLSRLAGAGAPSARPIFVFGMARSGTTLVEQILASHARVQGTGETTHLHDVVEKQLHTPALEFTPDHLAALGHQYLNRADPDPMNGLRFVDKTPSNFLYVGPISAILPGARMIHCRRNPLDTCLSSYSLLFKKGLEYSYDLGELGRYYRLYLELMEHWRNVLPAENMLEIDYDALVNDIEGQVRKILDFCALPWDANCLRFYDTDRRVTTASLDQVRAPIFKTSVGRAQPFRPWLGALEAALASPIDYAN
jgi:tetratricopeptide (TPR) repeat protein